MTKGKKACVIGGGGFLGRHLVEELIGREYSVSVFDIRETYKMEGVQFHVGDLRRKEDLLPALEGVWVVFDVASPAPLSGNRKLFEDVNVHGTKVVIEACKEAGVQRFVLTSSASVVYDGSDLSNADEDTPYAAVGIDPYTETKIEQEKIVLAANNTSESRNDVFMTIAIRPHGIFGPRDATLVPTLVEMAKLGKTKWIIGNGNNIVDFTYVKNVVHGHILAAESLTARSKSCGKAYFITNDEPVKFWDFLGDILSGLGYSKPSIHLPYMLVYTIAIVISFFVSLLRPIKQINPTFTPLKVALAGTHHYYNCSRAKKDLGYKPLVSLEDGIAKTVMAFQHLRKEKNE